MRPLVSGSSILIGTSYRIVARIVRIRYSSLRVKTRCLGLRDKKVRL